MGRALILAVLLVVGTLAGCGGGGGDSALGSNVNAVISGWRALDASRVAPYVSDSYYFNGTDRAGYLSGLAADFADIDSVTNTSYDVTSRDADHAWVEVHFVAYMYLDIASLDHEPIYDVAYTRNTLRQLWIKDFDGEWRIIAEYLRSAYAVRNTPVLSDLSLTDGDSWRAGTSHLTWGTASADSTRYRVTMWVDLPAASTLPPANFGWGAVDFEGTVTVDPLADGPYAFSYIGQTDDPATIYMRGRTLRGVYLEIYGAAFAGPRKPAPAAQVKSSLAPLRIRHAARGKLALPMVEKK